MTATMINRRSLIATLGIAAFGGCVSSSEEEDPDSNHYISTECKGNCEVVESTHAEEIRPFGGPFKNKLAISFTECVQGTVEAVLYEEESVSGSYNGEINGFSWSMNEEEETYDFDEVIFHVDVVPCEE